MTASWTREKKMVLSGAKMGSTYWIYFAPCGKRLNSRPLVKAHCKDSMVESGVSKLSSGEASGSGKPLVGQDKPALRSGDPAKSDAVEPDDGEIAAPSGKAPAPAITNQEKHGAADAADPVTPKKVVQAEKPASATKRTLLDRASSPGAAKKRKGDSATSSSPPASSSPDAKSSPLSEIAKRSTCDICGVERPADQRGAGCPTCVTLLRKQCGHQSLKKLRADETLMANIAAASLKLREEAEPAQVKPLKRFKNATDKRLYRSKLVKDVSETIMSKCASQEEAVSFVSAVVKKIESTVDLPLRTALSNHLLQDLASNQVAESQWHTLLEGLGSIRQKVATNQSQCHLPRISVQDLDLSVVKCGIPRAVLAERGYNIGKVLFGRLQNDISSGSTSDRPVSRVGRKSKVDSEAEIAFVKNVLGKYSNDSSKVVTVRIQGEKRLVCAHLLSKRLWRIWKEEKNLRERLAFTTFKKLARKHFPTYRKPGRKTDVCQHCRVLKKHILPRAEAAYAKHRRLVAEVLPSYFDDFDAHPNTIAYTQADQQAQIIIRAKKYLNLRNSRSDNDPARSVLSGVQRLELFQREARAVHKLKGHTDLLEAYTWHKLSAERQREFADNLLENLGQDVAYFHFDFKENVRYPMAKEETGDEWHAQNKLSLTVFGVVVHTPGRKNFQFLLVSEVLDHDSQMARVLLERVLDIVSSRPAYKWDQVKHLHLVCDCGPHFRSRVPEDEEDVAPAEGAQGGVAFPMVGLDSA
ncbi:hypothetical protein AK812_SmicGene1651 [Symbiodinium microadriaticum]|uniref:Uncharacterized protein n=1 Tax=Symbiodinium microadriaticum TaxID=2951 RepID=A0A1Q9F3E8_SYMMI|nr:hypothetical protein AK812_SmicGene1651 [Symbiodinium microadriaticum]